MRVTTREPTAVDHIRATIDERGEHARIIGRVVFEVGISYNGRTYADGKKIGWRDGVRAFYCIVRYSPVGERFMR